MHVCVLVCFCRAAGVQGGWDNAYEYLQPRLVRDLESAGLLHQDVVEAIKQHGRPFELVFFLFFFGVCVGQFVFWPLHGKASGSLRRVPPIIPRLEHTDNGGDYRVCRHVMLTIPIQPAREHTQQCWTRRQCVDKWRGPSRVPSRYV